MEGKHLYKIHIRGWVQGVGFRYSALREARILGITGYVKNLSDGSVYIEAEGPVKQLNIFLEWCKKGPGIVETVTSDVFPPVDFTDFRIEH